MYGRNQDYICCSQRPEPFVCYFAFRSGEYDGRPLLKLDQFLCDGRKYQRNASRYGFGINSCIKNGIKNSVEEDKQKLYGATDAWACIQLYEEYVRLKESNDYFLEFVPEPDTAATPASSEEKKDSEEKPKKKQNKRRKTYSKRKPRVKKEKEETPKGEVKSEE